MRENKNWDGGGRDGNRDFSRNKQKDQGPRINEEIRIHECRLIGDDGHAYGVVSMSEARRISDDVGLDLVEVSPQANPPVVKLIDYGKYKYELQKKAAEAKKKQVVVQIKELQFRPNIEQHDLLTKLKKAEQFLEENDKVKLVMSFRGREIAYKDAGMEKFMNIVNTIKSFGSQVESEPKFLGNRIIAIMMPDKKAKTQTAADLEKKNKE